MALTVGFILPSSDYLFDPFRGDPFTHFQILTVLEDFFGAQIRALLIDLRGVKREFAAYHIPECDVYLHSVYTLDLEEQSFIIQALRQRYPKAVHIAGGPHANVFPDATLKIADALVVGEGEQSVIQAIRDFGESKLRRIYEQREPIDINHYPYWRRNFLPESAVVRRNLLTLKNRAGFDQLMGATAMFSRGCPYQCRFCAIRETRSSAPGIRYRSPKLVAAEIEYLKRVFGVQGLVLSDEIAIPLKREAAREHLEAIGAGGIAWRGQCRVDGITRESAALARESGCIALGLGVESVSQQSLDIINKKTEVKEAGETIKLLKENGIEARVYLIIGLPGEPEDIVEKTWAFIQETDPDLVYLSLFTIRPGTDVFHHPEKFGIKSVDPDWRKTMHMYGRYSDERPVMNFEYAEQTPWGRGMSADEIVGNYLELQNRLKERGLSSAYYDQKPQS